jgi:hypothetical protein
MESKAANQPGSPLRPFTAIAGQIMSISYFCKNTILIFGTQSYLPVSVCLLFD